MHKPTITLFVDSVSPFAYLAFYALRNFDVFKQCDIDYVPIFLGGLLHKCGNPTPISITSEFDDDERGEQKSEHDSQTKTSGLTESA